MPCQTQKVLKCKDTMLPYINILLFVLRSSSQLLATVSQPSPEGYLQEKADQFVILQCKESKNKLQKQNSLTFLDFTCNCVYIFLSVPLIKYEHSLWNCAQDFSFCRHLTMNQTLSYIGSIHLSK